MAQDMQFMRESPFCYFLDRRDLERSAQSLARVLESLILLCPVEACLNWTPFWGPQISLAS